MLISSHLTIIKINTILNSLKALRTAEPTLDWANPFPANGKSVAL